MAAKDELIRAPQDNALTSHVLESLIVRGDISALGPGDKAEYNRQLCERVGLDPATTPFQPLKLNGKEILYATKGAAEQLRKLHKISVTISARERIEDVYYVTARASTPDGRTDESQGAVSIAGMRGDNLANAVMKAETKAKRRVTLSIVGLGMLDESELETIQGQQFAKLQEGLQANERKAEVVQAPSNVAQLKTATAAKKESKAPVKKWTSDDALPDVILRALPEGAALKGKTLAQLGEEDLEALIEQAKRAYGEWSAMPGVNPKLLALLREITVMAQAYLDKSLGLVPPDYPPPDVNAPPADFDPTTGEVRS
jgi:hypothetical protein